MNTVCVWCFVFLSLAFLGCEAGDKFEDQPQFIIHGSVVSKVDSAKIYLARRGHSLRPDETMEVLDSSLVIKGEFTLVGHIDEPAYWSLVSPVSASWKPFILENITYQVSGNLDTLWKVEMRSDASSTLAESEIFARILNPLIHELNDMSDSNRKYSAEGEFVLSKVYSQINQKLHKRISSATVEFIEDYPDSYVSLYAFRRITPHYSLQERREIFDLLSSRLKSHSFADEIRYTLRDSNLLYLTGNQISDVSYQDTHGIMKTMRSHTKDYLLIDFWASWCAPCRKKHPSLKVLYDENHEQLEILGISLDSDTDKWLNAIKVDSIQWPQILDKQQKVSIVKEFGVSQIPSSFLVDRSGVIVGRDLDASQIRELLLHPHE